MPKNLIYHITEYQTWENAKQSGTYRGDTLDTEGFIHCSTSTQIVKTANKFYRHHHGLVLLCIDSNQVNPEIRYEEADNQLFPHIYGALNIDSVFQVIKFAAGEEGLFELPEQIRFLAEVGESDEDKDK
ncbi:MAG: DUF952 domain-containing protein [Cyanobacteria bacterium P01_A01_bin.84]